MTCYPDFPSFGDLNFTWIIDTERSFLEIQVTSAVKISPFPSITQSVEQHQLPKVRNMRLVFTEPEIPEETKYRPVPIPARSFFVHHSFEPPFRENFDINLPPQTPAPPPADTAQVPLQSHAIPATSPRHGPLNFANLVLSTLRPDNETLIYANTFTHLTISHERIPLSYILDQIPQVYEGLYLHQQSSTHTLHLTDLNGQNGTFPIHDLVLVAQCLRLPVIEQTAVCQVISVENVPDVDSFGILLRWLYAHDERELYEMLRQAVGIGGSKLLAFAQNCKFWGIVDERVVRVVRSILEELE